MSFLNLPGYIICIRIPVELSCNSCSDNPGNTARIIVHYSQLFFEPTQSQLNIAVLRCLLDHFKSAHNLSGQLSIKKMNIAKFL